MKARVKATGEIVKVHNCSADTYIEKPRGRTRRLFHITELDFNNLESPDYWTRLEHQAAIAAMQGLSEKYLKEYRDFCADYGEKDEDFSPGAVMEDFANAMADVCYYFARALVEKLKKGK